MGSSSNTNAPIYIWTDEETRFFLQLIIEERDKGNTRKGGISETGRQNILAKFYETFGKKHTWEKFKNKYNTCKKQYGSFKSLTHRTGLGYDSNGFIDMSDDWWAERIKEWHGAKKFREKSLANMDLMERIYGSVHISGAEGWSAQQGEEQLDSIMPEELINESDAVSDSRKTAPPPPTQAGDAPSSSNKSRANKKRRVSHEVADAIRDSSQSRDAILSQKNQLLEQHPDFSCSQIRAMRVLHSLSSVKMWSPLYKAAILHLQTNSTNRQTFLGYEDDENKLKESSHVYLEESVAMFIEMVAQDITVRVIAERYQHSFDTVKRKLDEVLSVLLKLAADNVKPARGEFTRPSPTLVNDRRYWPYFADCIGALDGTHVPVRPPSHNVEPFMGRKGEATMNVLAICNFEMKFIYAYVGVPGRAHDTKVLTYCATEEPFFPHPPNGKYYLVDSGYPTRVGYLGPHRKTRYHLDQFNRGGPPTNTRELFNRKHSGLRSVIERTFGVWKAKWRILDRKHPKYELNKWVKIVTATMALHNFIRDSHNDDCDFVHWERMDEYEQHGDQVVENEHVRYMPVGDREMETLRDNITREIAGERLLPY